MAIPELDRAIADAVRAESSDSYRRGREDRDPDQIPRIRELIDELTELRRDLQNI